MWPKGKVKRAVTTAQLKKRLVSHSLTAVHVSSGSAMDVGSSGTYRGLPKKGTKVLLKVGQDWRIVVPGLKLMM